MPTSPSTLTNMPVTKLTEAKLDGSGVFDVLMRATKAHLDQEFSQNRIKGTEYSQVYLGSLTAVMENSLRFLLDKDKSFYEIALVEAQVRLADAQVRLVEKQIEKEDQEAALRAAQVAKINREILTMDISDNLLTAQVLLAQAQKISTDAQSALVIQKTNTEKAQTLAAGVDVDSVVGKQKALYQSQIDGFKRDAEQKAAKLLVDTWNVRRTTDEGTVADSTNRLNDSTVGKAVEKLLDGVGVVL